MPPCLTLSIIRYGSRVKWSSPGKGVAPSPTPWCSSYRKGGFRVTLDYGHQLIIVVFSLRIFRNLDLGIERVLRCIHTNSTNLESIELILKIATLFWNTFSFFSFLCSTLTFIINSLNLDYFVFSTFLIYIMKYKPDFA